VGVWSFKPLPTKFRSFDKAEPNSQFRGKYIHKNLIRIGVSLICKFPRGLPPPDPVSTLPGGLKLNCRTPPPHTKFIGYGAVSEYRVPTLTAIRFSNLIAPYLCAERYKCFRPGLCRRRQRTEDHP
jgi:hypothetical protein